MLILWFHGLRNNPHNDWVGFHPQRIPNKNQLYTLKGSYIPYIPHFPYIPSCIIYIYIHSLYNGLFIYPTNRWVPCALLQPFLHRFTCLGTRKTDTGMFFHTPHDVKSVSSGEVETTQDIGKPTRFLEKKGEMIKIINDQNMTFVGISFWVRLSTSSSRWWPDFFFGTVFLQNAKKCVDTKKMVKIPRIQSLPVFFCKVCCSIFT